MLLLMGFAFLAGIVTLASPCVLAVLPALLAGTGGPQGRPWGIVIGFVVTFLAVALGLSSLVSITGFNPESLRWTGAALLLFFGALWVFPAGQEVVERLFAKLTRRTLRPLARPSSGWWAGLTIGASLGVLWTPCVGPIMASVLTLAATQRLTWQAAVVAGAYTVGTGLALTALIFGGRRLTSRLTGLRRHWVRIQQIFGVLMVVVAILLAAGLDRSLSTWVLQHFPKYGSGLTAIEQNERVQAELAHWAQESQNSAGQEIPESLFEPGLKWINSPGLGPGDLKGKVVLIDVWTYSCVNCLRTLPVLQDWYRKYGSRGLVIIGVHSPEFAFEKSTPNVEKAARNLGVSWPVVQDNDFLIWNSLSNQYWPAHYLYDRQGRLVSKQFGEGGYSETERDIAKALGVPGEPTVLAPSSSGDQTPETYLGWGRGQRFASPETVVANKPSRYTFPTALAPDLWALEGEWTIEKEGSSAPKGRLAFRFRGTEANLVVAPLGTSVTMTISQSAGQISSQTIDGPRMYNLVRRKPGLPELATVDFGGPVRIYALTFGGSE